MSDSPFPRVAALSAGLICASLGAVYAGVGASLARHDAVALSGLSDASQKQADELYGAVRRTPWNTSDYIRLGMFFLTNNRPAPAVEWLRRATIINEGSYEPWYYLGLAQRAAHRFTDAGTAFRTGLRLNPDYVAARVQLANLLLDEGHYADAAAAFEDLAHSDADKTRVAQGLGTALLHVPDYPAAERAFRLAISRFPSYGDAHGGLSLALKAQGDERRAAAEARLAYNLRAIVPIRTDDPLTEKMEQDFPTGLSLFQSAARNRDPRASIPIMERAVLLDPSMTFGWEYLIALYGSAHRVPDAEKAWVSLLRLDPSNVRGRYELGAVLTQNQERPKARDLLNRTLVIDPGFADARRMLGVAAQLDGDAEEAARQFREAVAIDPALAEAYVDLGLLLLKNGDAKQGQAALLRALAPPCEQPERTLRRELAALKDSPEEPAFEQAVRAQAAAQGRLELVTLLNNRKTPAAAPAPGLNLSGPPMTGLPML